MSKKNIIILLIVFIAIPIAISLAFIVFRSINSASVRFLVAPHTVDLEYANKTKVVKNGDVLNFKPGEYTFRFTRGEFETAERHVTLEQNTEITIPVQLMELTSAAVDEMNSQDNQIALQSIADYQHGLDQAASKTNPTINMLPFKNFLFSIDYRETKNPGETDPPYIITINAAPGYRISAINKLKSWGYTPSDYKIEFTNFKNPFKP